MAITPGQIGGDENIARRVLVLARDIAPCIDSFADDSEQQKNAIAILAGVAAESKVRGARFVQSQSIGPARVAYTVGSAFTDDDRDALRALCTAAAQQSSRPVGSFPTARPIGRVWPEGGYS